MLRYRSGENSSNHSGVTSPPAGFRNSRRIVSKMTTALDPRTMAKPRTKKASRIRPRRASLS